MLTEKDNVSSVESEEVVKTEENDVIEKTPSDSEITSTDDKIDIISEETDNINEVDIKKIEKERRKIRNLEEFDTKQRQKNAEKEAAELFDKTRHLTQLEKIRYEEKIVADKRAAERAAIREMQAARAAAKLAEKQAQEIRATAYIAKQEAEKLISQEIDRETREYAGKMLYNSSKAKAEADSLVKSTSYTAQKIANKLNSKN